MTVRRNIFIGNFRYRCIAILLATGVMALPVMPCLGQSSPQGNSGSQISSRPSRPRLLDDPSLSATNPIFYEKRVKVLNAAQHQSMVADTDRLVKLVADLNAQINNSHESALTPAQQRMVAEIEKLAHNVRDKMRMTVRSAELDGPPASPFGAK